MYLLPSKRHWSLPPHTSMLDIFCKLQSAFHQLCIGGDVSVYDQKLKDCRCELHWLRVFR